MGSWLQEVLEQISVGKTSVSYKGESEECGEGRKKMQEVEDDIWWSGEGLTHKEKLLVLICR